ncbi:hypothetical protein [Aquimarina sp. RZ0]|uniref:hypothetical protein n=1 Tax=Aquimarina sp. RZ0 TaxID=2607730 RepID=UPI0011F0F28E|nr:hypothetical protein [Aquimarina sp. RZ0]KAA1246548.1 hypothetical protein F0000_07240 [Aquimarina sp. RZ0]
MKNFTLLAYLGIFTCTICFYSCSGSKEIPSADADATYKYYKVKKKNQKAVTGHVNSKEIVLKAYNVIQKHTTSDMNDIALSKITKTKSGYHWRFANVKTGKNYIATANHKFEAVNIYEKPKESKKIITNL